jgi:hypothetical protein
VTPMYAPDIEQQLIEKLRSLDFQDWSTRTAR